LKSVVEKYSHAKEWYWVQEEPENMGGWQFIKSRIEDIVKQSVGYIGRKAASSPATGFPAISKQEQNRIIEQAVGPPPNQRKKTAVN
jgi:2-oxoglutarate dehydrogenase E1 component